VYVKFFLGNLFTIIIEIVRNGLKINTETKPMLETNVGANLMFALQTKTETKPMLETNVGANLMFALQTKTETKPMSENKI
jgi:hypothetical protein